MAREPGRTPAGGFLAARYIRKHLGLLELVGVSHGCPPRPYVRFLHMSDVRVTVAVARVLREFVADASEPRYGYELMQLTGFPSGKLYPILARLQQAGWVSREREDIDPADMRRPARYLYRLTPGGAEAAWSELTVLTKQIAPAPVGVRSRQPQWEGGLA